MLHTLYAPDRHHPGRGGVEGFNDPRVEAAEVMDRVAEDHHLPVRAGCHAEGAVQVEGLPVAASYFQTGPGA